MRKHCLLAVVATAALFLGAASTPSQALDLNRTIGTVTRTVDKTVDGVTRTVDTAVDTVTGTGNGTQAVSKSTKVLAPTTNSPLPRSTDFRMALTRGPPSISKLPPKWKMTAIRRYISAGAPSPARPSPSISATRR